MNAARRHRPPLRGCGAYVLLAAAVLTSAPACGDGGGRADAATDGGRVYVPEPFEPTAETIAYCQGRDDAAIEARITEWLAVLEPRQKVAMMHGASLGLVEGSWRVEGAETLGIPGLRMLDGPRGVSAFTRKNATAFPVAMMRGATWDPALEERVGGAIAAEIRSTGADVVLAPTMNILRHPRWGRAQETYSEDVHHLGEMAVAFIRGVQSEGVIASAKHYAANSIDDTRFFVDVQIDERTLREIYLPHFRRAVTEAHVGSVMSAYNSVNGQHCDTNPHLLGDILKGEWGFAGFVESDWLAGTHSDVESLRAGLDIEMPAGSYYPRLLSALDRAEVTEVEIDRALRRILRAQLCFGLDDRGPPDDDPVARETPEHLALAREVAQRGITLLLNRPPDGSPAGTPPVLPVAPSTRSIAVLGRAADVDNIGDEGSSNVLPSDIVTALEGLGQRAGTSATVTHVAGTTLDAAQEAAVRASDVAVIVTGLLAADEGEALIAAGDRASLEIPPAEVALIHAVAAIHPAVVVVLEGGAAFTTASWDTEVEALVHAFYPGSEGGHALADVLFGDVSPSGRLPFSMPEAEADLPPFDNVSHAVTYGFFHGYRHLAREGSTARYPFGFGLTYATFDYADLRLSAVTVPADGIVEATVRVTNTGAVRGRETVQVYVAAVGSRVERASQDLRGFAQVELAPSASEDVTVTIRAADLAFWDAEASAWEVEPVTYEIRVGSHSADPRLVAAFAID